MYYLPKKKKTFFFFSSLSAPAPPVSFIYDASAGLVLLKWAQEEILRLVFPPSSLHLADYSHY